MAETATSTVPYAVMSTTSVSAERAFTVRSSSSPLIPGIMRSVTTTLGRSRRSTSSASVPDDASATRQPSLAKMRPSDSRLERSSSTMSTRAGTSAHPYTARSGPVTPVYRLGPVV